MRFSHRVICLFCGMAIMTAAAFTLASGPDGKTPIPGQPGEEKNQRARAQAALERLNSLIGGWRGAGQAKFGSNRGAWLEQAEWVWDFDENAVAIDFQVESGKQLQHARLTFDPEPQQYVLTGKLANATERVYRGQFEDKRLVLESQPDETGNVHRISVDRPNDKRAVVRYERRLAAQSIYTQVAIVGYTRKGTRLATNESSGPECIVTGGAGTMRVSHNGQEYYVCCTGCRDAFEADPEAIIAEARKKRQEKK